MRWTFYVIYSKACLVFLPRTRHKRAKKSFPLCFMSKAGDLFFINHGLSPDLPGITVTKAFGKQSEWTSATQSCLCTYQQPKK